MRTQIVMRLVVESAAWARRGGGSGRLFGEGFGRGFSCGMLGIWRGEMRVVGLSNECFWLFEC